MDLTILIEKTKNLLQNRFFQMLLFLILGLFSFILMYNNVKPEKVDVRLLEASPQTIRAPKTIEDIEKTELEKQNILKQVPDEYVLKREVTQNRLDLLTSIFDAVKEVQAEKENLLEQQEKINQLNAQATEESTKLPDAKIPTVDEQLNSVKNKMTEDINKSIPDWAYRSMIMAKPSDLQTAQDATLTAVNTVMSNQVSADEVENAKKNVEQQLQYTSLNSELRRASIELGRFVVTQNYFLDRDKTEEARQNAIESVEPVRILQGQVIVEQGQLVDREIYRQLELTGLLDTNNSIFPFIGLGSFLFLLMGALYHYFQNYVDEDGENNKTTQLLIFSLVFMLAIIIMKTLSLFTKNDLIESGYFFPAAMGAMLVKILLNDRFATAFTIVMSLFATLIFNVGTTSQLNYVIGIYVLLSGLAGILLLSTRNFRSKILQAGLLLSLVNLTIIFSILFIMDVQFSNMEYAFYTLAAFVSGLVSSVLTIGLLPFFEAGFGIISTIKLIELSNPNHPLLRKILTEAPGTYHHSVMVANLAEAACEAIGANGLLARVGCYYHDIGKTKRPQFFIENQMNIENPHDRLAPATSKDIIVAHAVDGGKMLRRYKMPQEIIDIAEQHHGTTLLKFFYHKAVNDGENVSEIEYRYPGPKAQTKETAIVGIADSVEAAVRSLKQPTPDTIKKLVKSIIQDRLKDEQFDECDITMKELNIVEKSLCETMNGIFHSRIEYPEFNNTNQKKGDKL
ncbi:HD family phosphohydrolase [Peribacillus alkalitolerans]|uniref:HD family phosphohydrolase n=1 Tax=Peribacillus alkalitolerans TaxID=1550385 RepID=UPI001F07EAAF|nr:HD family phosphohydrolase [Peribacillus alkalitolerans]